MKLFEMASYHVACAGVATTIARTTKILRIMEKSPFWSHFIGSEGAVRNPPATSLSIGRRRRALMLAAVDEPLVGKVRKDGADVALLVGEDGARIVVRRAGLDVDAAPKPADAGHGIGVQR